MQIKAFDERWRKGQITEADVAQLQVTVQPLRLDLAREHGAGSAIARVAEHIKSTDPSYESVVAALTAKA